MDLDRPLRREVLVTVERQTQPIPLVVLDSLQVGGATVKGLTVGVFDLPAQVRADGLLGLDFLRHFRVTFEFDTGVLVLRERR